MTQKTIGQFEPKAGVKALVIALVLSICITWLYRQQILNGFTILAGDRYDGVISTTILEHWYNVLCGNASWVEVNYFYPHARSLANTDGYFIVGMIYAPFRYFGLDPFSSAEIANIIVKGIGFLGMYWMCRRVFSLPFHWAVLGAVFFTLSNGMTSHPWRSQLATVAFSPIMAVLICNAGNAIKSDNFRKVRLFGALAGLLFGAWCLTCFYAAWFFLYFFIAFAVIMLVCSGKTGLSFVKTQISRHAGSYLFVLAIALLALGPFLYAFLPKSLETGVRPYSSSLFYTVPPENILQLGSDNLFEGKFYNQLLLKLEPSYIPASEYYNTGFGVLLFLLFVLAAVHIFRHESRGENKLILSVLLATLMTWLTTLNFGGYSLWYLIFHSVPGAKALRVVSAYHIFLALPIVTLTVRYLASRKINGALVVLLSSLLILEELNTPPIGLVKKVELARIELKQSPPIQCKAFYTSGWQDQGGLPPPAELYAHNVSAMLIAQQLKIPTVNGFASFMAPDWDFANPQLADYDARIRSYASKNHVKGLCRLDLNDKTWSVVDPETIRMNAPFFDKNSWKGGAIQSFSGLSGEEPWGRWSNAKVIQFEFTKPLPAKFELRVTGHAFAQNNGKDFIATLTENSFEDASPSGVAHKFKVGAEDREQIIRFDNPRGLNSLSIIVPEPISPKDLGGGSEDDRKIGLGLVKLGIIPL